MATVGTLGAINIYVGDDACDKVRAIRKAENRQRLIKPVKTIVMDRSMATGEMINYATCGDIDMGTLSTKIIPMKFTNNTMTDKKYTKSRLAQKYHTLSLPANVSSQGNDAKNMVTIITHPSLKKKPYMGQGYSVPIEEVLREKNYNKVIEYIVQKRVSAKSLAIKYAVNLGYLVSNDESVIKLDGSMEQFWDALVEDYFPDYISGLERVELEKKLGKYILPHLFNDYVSEDEEIRDMDLDEDWLDNL
jgi:hypothetical protein